MLALEKAPLEDQDETLDEIEELTQSCEGWLACADQRVLTERYFKGEVCLVVEMRLKEPDAEKFVAVSKIGPLDVMDLDPAARAGCLNLEKSGLCRDNPSMFVHDIQLANLKENITLAVSVGLQSADILFGIRAPLKKLGRFGFVETVLPPMYREVCFFKNVLRGHTVSADQGGGERVQGAHKVVDDIPNDGAPCVRGGVTNAELVDFYRGFRILIDYNAVRIGVSECADRAVEIVKVLFGPINFEPATKQRVIAHG
jgi:hypothetical protein